MTEMKAFAEQIAGTMNMEENGTEEIQDLGKKEDQRNRVLWDLFCREGVRCFPGRVPGTVL